MSEIRARLRQHAQADSATQRRLEHEIDEWSRKLIASVLPRIKRMAERAYASSRTLQDEFLATVNEQLWQAIQSLNHRHGLENRFDPSFHSLLFDAMRRISTREGQKLSEITVSGESTEEGETSLLESVPSPNISEALTKVQIEEVLELAERHGPQCLQILKFKLAGYFDTQIAELLGLDRSTVVRRMRELGRAAVDLGLIDREDAN